MTENKILFTSKPKEGEPWDVVIIGSGPAALTAAIYTTRGAASTLILGGEVWGGQLMLTTTVDNFPGFPEGVQGPDLMALIRKQAERFGAEFVPKNVDLVNFDPPSGRYKELRADNITYKAKAVIIATGADTKWLGVKGEDILRGRGVSSCAPCDAPFFKNKKVFVVGGGDSAMEEALVLTKYAKEVIIVHRRGEFRASAAMQKKIDDQVERGVTKIMWNSEIIEFVGEGKLEKVKLKNTENGKVTEEKVDGVFVAIGHIPSTKALEGKVELDDKGYVKKGGNEIFRTATNKEGVFVAGDVHDYHYRQAITAAGFGCMAGMEALRYLDKNTPSW